MFYVPDRNYFNINNTMTLLYFSIYGMILITTTKIKKTSVGRK